MKVLVMQIRREFWEHRSLWIAPLLVGILLLIAVATLNNVQFSFGGFAPAQIGVITPLRLMLFGWGIPFYLAAGIVVVVYLLDCLYGERRDRSILFWRSMPVSDTQTVLAKLLVGLVIVPYASYLLAAVTSVIASVMLLLRHHALVNGQPPPAWNGALWLRTELGMLWGMTVLLLWYAPYATYLMLASVWARRSPYAWAFLPPVLLALFESMLIGTHYVGAVVQRGLALVLRTVFNLDMQLRLNFGYVGPRSSGNLWQLLYSPQLWLGLLAAALMLALVIRLRRYRDDS